MNIPENNYINKDSTLPWLETTLFVVTTCFIVTTILRLSLVIFRQKNKMSADQSVKPSTVAKLQPSASCPFLDKHKAFLSKHREHFLKDLSKKERLKIQEGIHNIAQGLSPDDCILFCPQSHGQKLRLPFLKSFILPSGRTKTLEVSQRCFNRHLTPQKPGEEIDLHETSIALIITEILLNTISSQDGILNDYTNVPFLQNKSLFKELYSVSKEDEGSLAYELYHKGELNDAAICAEIRIMITIGVTNTLKLIREALFRARDPENSQLIHQIAAELEDRYKTAPKDQAILESPTLNSFLLECLRLGDIGEKITRKGTDETGDLPALARDPHIVGSNPDTFNWKRAIHADVGNSWTKVPYLALGHGPHRCPGWPFTETTTKLLFAQLFKHWTVEIDSFTERSNMGLLDTPILRLTGKP